MPLTLFIIQEYLYTYRYSWIISEHAIQFYFSISTTLFHLLSLITSLYNFMSSLETNQCKSNVVLLKLFGLDVLGPLHFYVNFYKKAC